MSFFIFLPVHHSFHSLFSKEKNMLLFFSPKSDEFHLLQGRACSGVGGLEVDHHRQIATTFELPMPHSLIDAYPIILWWHLKLELRLRVRHLQVEFQHQSKNFSECKIFFSFLFRKVVHREEGCPFVATPVSARKVRFTSRVSKARIFFIFLFSERRASAMNLSPPTVSCPRFFSFLNVITINNTRFFFFEHTGEGCKFCKIKQTSKHHLNYYRFVSLLVFVVKAWFFYKILFPSLILKIFTHPREN